MPVKLDYSTRPVRDCKHPRARHVHGTKAAYQQDLCRCRPCTEEASHHREAAKWRAQTMRSRGETVKVDSGPVADHVDRLLATGMAVEHLARACGVSDFTIRRIRSRKVVTVTASVATKLLAVTVPTPRNVPIHGMNRRLQALVALGWPMVELSARLGVEPNRVTSWFYRGQPTVRYEMHLKVKALYDELWNKFPNHHGDPIAKRSIKVARTIAARNGWPLPLDWDDDAIDQVDTTPVRSAS